MTSTVSGNPRTCFAMMQTENSLSIEIEPLLDAVPKCFFQFAETYDHLELQIDRNSSIEKLQIIISKLRKLELEIYRKQEEDFQKIAKIFYHTPEWSRAISSLSMLSDIVSRYGSSYQKIIKKGKELLVISPSISVMYLKEKLEDQIKKQPKTGRNF